MTDERPPRRDWITDELLQETVDVWSPEYGHRLSEEEAVEILVNARRFLEVLLVAGKEADRT